MKYLLFALIAITILIVLCFLTKNFFFTMKDNTKTNTIVIPTGLRFKTTEVKLLDRYFTTAEAGKVQNLSIVFAKSSYRSGVQSYDINIESGYIKFITIDGYIKFLPNNIVKAKGKDPISEVTVQYRNNDNNIIIGTGGVGMNLVGIIKPKNFIYNHKGANNLIGQKLPSVQDDNKVTLDLKIELSDDFRGFINNWKVEPNWL